ncbi:glutamine synthetase family protein [Hoeflea prorocentri]|uniref:Glutamine synthetase family protein n=1 Tax=Hoeflea prorocentri TaxID=1922333 RepID=A0A9X3UJ71_9HYPH|nr:glutamine synthetase family protein [Hoeflea prorocentri]MCY6381410.1 glutamine synthetase family protein [Hoeflea prorocentri]MDA5399210.1 glutamine synthetase family protein [Hoeflea prorocentri]
MTESRKDTDLIMVVTSDIAGQLRGKAMPHSAREERSSIGVGWTPTNVFQTSLGPIADTPWGALGDLILRPDFSTLVDLKIPQYGVDECFVMGNVLTLDERRWECCLRGQLASAVETLRRTHGLSVSAAFEHEFHYSGAEGQEGLGYSLEALRRLGSFPNRLMDALNWAGLVPDTFSPEFGPAQCEVTVKPNEALRAADDAVVLREITRAVAVGLDARASFTPIVDPKTVGNGVHVHFSLFDLDGQPVDHDARRPNGVSDKAGSFLAGVLKYMPDFLCMTAPSVASYMRLTPHRWSAAFNNLGVQDREAAVRICPVFKSGADEDVSAKFHFEYRASDAAASPYLLLAAIVRAGTSGLDEALQPPQATGMDLTEAGEAELFEISVSRLPGSLAEALDGLESSDWARSAFGDVLVDTYLRHKRCEVELMQDLSDDEICARYAAVY